MHGFSQDKMSKMISILKLYGVSYKVAVTETTDRDLQHRVSSLKHVGLKNIIVQKFAKNDFELIKPVLGVLAVNGRINESLSTKF